MTTTSNVTTDRTLTEAGSASSAGSRRATWPNEALHPRYEVLGAHARGGAGEILVAEDLDLQRQVAIKRPLDKSHDARERFAREAHLTARLQHPGIAAVYDAGLWSDGMPYYAMPLVDGDTLEALAAAATTEARRMALIPHITGACRTIAYAHAEGVVHRDIKPSNILVGTFGETLVIDWGAAKELDDGAGEEGRVTGGPYRAHTEPTLTARGKIVGTPAHMAPEQARGVAADERTDVYGLGGLVYAVLTGQAPYPGLDTDEILTRLQMGATPRVPDDEGSAELRAICRRAMHPDPKRRYPSAQALADDLARLQAGKLVGAYRYTIGRRLWRLAKMYRTSAIAGVLAIALASVIIVGWRLMERETVRAETETARVSAAAPLPDRFAEEVANPALTAYLQEVIDEVPLPGDWRGEPFSVLCRGDICRIEGVSERGGETFLQETVLRSKRFPLTRRSRFGGGGGRGWYRDETTGADLQHSYTFHEIGNLGPARTDGAVQQIWDKFRTSDVAARCQKLAPTAGFVSVVISFDPDRGLSGVVGGEFGARAAGRCLARGLDAHLAEANRYFERNRVPHRRVETMWLDPFAGQATRDAAAAE